MRLLCWPRVRSSTAAPVVTVRVCFSVAVVMIFVGAADNRAEPRDKVLLRVQVPSTLDSSVEDDDDWQDGQLSAAKTSIAQLTCKLFASFSGTETISNLLISVKVPDAVTTKQTTIVIPTLGTCGMVQCAVARGVLRPGPWWVPSVSRLTRAVCRTVCGFGVHGLQLSASSSRRCAHAHYHPPRVSRQVVGHAQ